MIKKILILFISVFFITVMILSILLLLYYITQKPYTLFELTEEYVLIKKNKITLNPYKKIIFDFNEYEDKYIKIDTKINLKFNNLIKSECLMSSNNLIRLNNNTKLIITNNENEDLIIDYNIYSKHSKCLY